MRPAERENIKYLEGKKNKIQEIERQAMKFLPERCSGILDIGCGEGSVTSELAKHCDCVKGIDFSATAVQLAKEKGIDAMVCDTDEGLPFPDKSFEVVWCGDIIEHVFDPLLLLQEVNRVIIDEGKVIVTIPNDMYLANRWPLLLGKSPQSHIYKRLKQVKHHSIISLELMKYFVTEGGFSIESFIAICRIPKIGYKFKTKSMAIGSLFANVFIMKLTKNNVSVS